jgi:hypothetical protein
LLVRPVQDLSNVERWACPHTLKTQSKNLRKTKGS